MVTFPLRFTNNQSFRMQVSSPSSAAGHRGNQECRSRKVEARLPLRFGSISLVRDRFSEPVDFTSAPDLGHVVALTFQPFPGRALGSYPDRRGKKYSAFIGELFLLPAGQSVRIRSECRQQTSLICNFQPETTGQWLGLDLNWADCRLQAALDIDNVRVRNLLSGIGLELRHHGFAREAMIEMMAGQVVIEISRHLQLEKEEKISGGLSPLLLGLIDQRLGDSTIPPSLSELADLCGLSPRHLSRAFQVSRGQSIGSYIADHRVETAKRLLATGRSIKAVAYDLGFSAPSNFTTAFRRATGMTPREYQQALNPLGTIRLHSARNH